MTTFNKIRWVASILLVFFIVLITNLIDKDNFNRLEYSVTTIYEDRIVASDLLFEISMWIQEKEVAVVSADSLFFEEENNKTNLDIDGLIQRYEQTMLTKKEQLIFNNLKEELSNLRELEKEYTHSETRETNHILKSLDEISQHLYDLSKVQLKEGRRQMFISNQAMDTIALFTQIEIVFLVLMAILIQIIIMYKPKGN
ncbi:hypothetical protein CLV24_1528 [Pontibacter ummariensis]|uniref:Four helix bundle sensory module for signal transduction n=1 Tax=Pontibacter ummariensis TaxID=1610492 RepID=A0A239LTJ3_9BACT|nr:chemotaxis protein [Pontibacter ummariensis]PRY01040.1 hypothetical protein CLV24_1528 [Pontibacter ummariensis]SNT33987.1 hypothetical protein SAMN06296052_1522 [Pontibacter ummariensis]